MMLLYCVLCFVLIHFIEFSLAIKCFGGLAEVGNETKSENYVDYICPSLTSCYIRTELLTVNDTALKIVRKGCLERATEADFENAVPCENFNLITSMPLNNGSEDVKCVCKRDFCNGSFDDDPNDSPLPKPTYFLILPFLFIFRYFV